MQDSVCTHTATSGKAIVTQGRKDKPGRWCSAHSAIWCALHLLPTLCNPLLDGGKQALDAQGPRESLQGKVFPPRTPARLPVIQRAGWHHSQMLSRAPAAGAWHQGLHRRHWAGHGGQAGSGLLVEIAARLSFSRMVRTFWACHAMPCSRPAPSCWLLRQPASPAGRQGLHGRHGPGHGGRAADRPEAE